MSDDIVMRLRAGFLAWRVSLLPEAADEIERLRSALDTAIRERDEARAEVERLRKEMLEVAEELENEEPRSHKNIAFGIRNALEAKP